MKQGLAIFVIALFVFSFIPHAAIAQDDGTTVEVEITDSATTVAGEEVREEVRERVRDSEGGGYISSAGINTPIRILIRVQ